MRAMVLWTINDFSARSSLSGWSGQGYKACPTCNKDTQSMRVLGKTTYVGHKRFLKKPHKWRRSLEFNGEIEDGDPPRKFDRDQIQAQLARLPTRVKGKHPSYGGVKIKRNVHAILNTLLMNDKSKDTAKARQDLKRLGIQSGLWLGQTKNGKCSKPQAAYSFTPENRKKFCQFIKGVKLPDGFGSNFKHKVTDNDTNITGLKSHDCHIMMQRLLPYGLQQYLPDEVAKPIIELCSFFKQICSATLMEDDMLKAQTSFEGGLSPPRVGFHFKDSLKKLKGDVRNKDNRKGQRLVEIRQSSRRQCPGVSATSKFIRFWLRDNTTLISVNSCVVNSVSHALIDVYEGEITLRVGKAAITFNLDPNFKIHSDYNPYVVNTTPLPNQNNSSWEFRKELKSVNIKTMSLPLMNLRDLSRFSSLTSEPSTWKLYYDIKGVNPEFCTHKNSKEEDTNHLCKSEMALGDARKLLTAPERSTFPLPSWTKCSKDLAGNDTMFLDALSGSIQIPIDPKDQKDNLFMPIRKLSPYRACLLGNAMLWQRSTRQKLLSRGNEVASAKVESYSKLPHPTTLSLCSKKDAKARLIAVVLLPIEYDIENSRTNKGAENLAADSSFKMDFRCEDFCDLQYPQECQSSASFGNPVSKFSSTTFYLLELS
ncbi:zinc finger, PHD-type containing protein [Tanacetum coccineum]